MKPGTRPPTGVRCVAARLTIGLLIMVFGTACLDVCGGGSENAEANNDQQNQSNAQDTEDWYLEPVEGPVTPGEMLDLHVERIDVDVETDLVLWVDETDPRRFLDGSRDDGGTWTLHQRMPAWRDRTYELAVGTADEVRSNTVEVDVVVPEPAYSREEAATILSDGVAAITGNLGLVLENPDPQWQSFMSGFYTETDRRQLVEWAELAAGMSGDVRERYMELPDEDERAMQAVMSNAGLFEAFQTFAQERPGWYSPSALNFEQVIRRPVHRGLYQLDWLSASIEALGATMDVVTLISLIGGPTAASVPWIANVAINVLKFVIESFLPTDLVEVTPHVQLSPMFHGETAAWVYWGTFEPQDTAAGALKSVDGILIAALQSALPGPKSSPINPRNITSRRIEYLETLVRDVMIKAGFKTTQLTLEDGLKYQRIKAALDMHIYSLTFAELTATMPVVGQLIAPISELIDFDVFDSVRVLDYREDWAGDVQIAYEFEHDRLAFTSIDYPTGEDQAHVTPTAFFYHLENTSLWFTTAPTIILDSYTHGEKVVLEQPDPEDPNRDITTEDFVIIDVLGAEGNEGLGLNWINADTTQDRTYSITLEDNFNDPTSRTVVDIYVDGEPVEESLEIAGGFLQLPIALKPGINTITIIGRNGHAVPCAPHDTPICLEIGVPDAINADQNRGMYLELDQPGEVRIWTPPRISAE
jgi:hypothetical protein